MNEASLFYATDRPNSEMTLLGRKLNKLEGNEKTLEKTFICVRGHFNPKYCTYDKLLVEAEEMRGNGA